MKRVVEEARVIKRAENANPGSNPPTVISASTVAPTLINNSANTGTGSTTVFPTRAAAPPTVIAATDLSAQPLSSGPTAVLTPSGGAAAVTGGQGTANFTRVIAHTSGGGTSGSQGPVSVFREGGVAITAVQAGTSALAPPAAHGNSSSLPPNLHSVPTSNTGVSQSLSNLKPEPITLPNTPVSVQYTTTNFQPNLPKSLTSQQQPVAIQQPSSVQSLVQNLQQPNQAHHQQIIHQKMAHSQAAAISFAPQTIRNISSVNNLSASQQPPVPPAQISVTQQPAMQAPPSNASALVPPALGQGGNTQFQRLKVEDALSYLDQVKFKFGNQPQVYNDFLDIMKEFKSQSIDTPGVIARVSNLFRGHPELIVGFNTFLPPGYKIEIQNLNSVSVTLAGGAGVTTTNSNIQTIVHTPHGIQTMGPHGTMSALQVAPQPVVTNSISLTTTVATNPTRSTIPLSLAIPQQQTSLVNLKTGSTIPIKTETVHQPAPAHIQAQSFIQQQSSNSQQVGGSVHSSSGHHNNAPNNQPVEFNHAINYVNKIKHRFQGQPEVYKQFLEILHTYQKDQKAIKEGNPTSGRFLTETEVYAQVSRLFQNQEDLLSEFGQFLPEATGEGSPQTGILPGKARKPASSSANIGIANVKPYNSTNASMGYGTKYPGLPGKRPTSGISHSPPKKQRMGVLRDVTLAEAGKVGTLNEFAFFDKVRKAMKSHEMYENFLRCLILFNQEVLSRQELVSLVSPFLNKHPELFKWFKDFVGFKDGQGVITNNSVQSRINIESQYSNLAPQGRDRMSGDSAMEVDYTTCKRLGASYCALPKNFVQPKCNGRNLLCKEVLNDTWVSFPSWSEDSQFVTSRKTQFEEFIYRTEDERFESDMVIETNKDTIKVLECVNKKMCRMPPEEAARYKLDDCLGGSSATIHQRAIRRIYGDKANDIIDGLKRNPVVAVPLVLRRLKAKDEEWREAQKNFNKIWREQNEKYYLKSLDHQGIHWKQTDTRNLRSKSLLNEIEGLYDERHEQEESAVGNEEDVGEVPSTGPHMKVTYLDASVLEDANNLLIHHVKRQTSIHKDDKQKIKTLLKHFLLDLFKQARQELSDDERDDKEDEDEETLKEDQKQEQSEEVDDKESKSTRAERARKKKEEKREKQENGSSLSSSASKKKLLEVNEAEIKLPNSKDGRRTPLHARSFPSDESYSLMMCNNNWYLFLKLHHILCERLTKMYTQAAVIASEELKERNKKNRKESVALSLKLKPKWLYVTRPSSMRRITRTSAAVATNTSIVTHLQLSSLDGNSLFSENFNNLFVNPSLHSNSSPSDTQAREIDVEDYYPAFLDMVKNLLDGNMEPQSYEDTLREMFGIHAYVTFTLDKVITNAVRQLQYLVTDEAAVDCYDLFQSESKNNATGGPCNTAHERLLPELIYQKKAEKLLADENCMKIFIYHESHTMTVEMLDTESESQNSEQDEEAARKWHSYVERFIQPGEEVSEECKAHLSKRPIFLPRAIRSNHKFNIASVNPNDATKSKDKSGDEGNDTEVDKDAKRKESNEESSKEKRVPPLHNNGVIHDDQQQCQFDPKSYKILYIIKSENCFYRRFALKRAKLTHKKVSQVKTSNFNRWHSQWLRDNATEQQHRFVDDWFLGLTDGMVPNKTVKVVKNNVNIAPYRVLIKYKTDMWKTSSSTATTATSITTTSKTVISDAESKENALSLNSNV